jgi:murein L,D-transpeptidase YcbB/YkuD
MSQVAVLAAVLAFLGACVKPAPRAVTLQDIQAALDVELHGPPAGPAGRPEMQATAPQPDPKTVKIYQDRVLRPLWVTPAGPGKNVGILRGVFDAADTHGLNPKDYAVEEIGRLWDRKDAKGLARLDLLLTASLGDYFSDMIEGRRQPRDFDPKAFPTACDCEVDRPALLERALAAPDLKAFLEEQAPPFDEYSGLRRKLAEYRALAVRGGWPQVPPGAALRPGDRDPRVAAVRRRLVASGEWPADDPGASAFYDGTLAAAVMRFQRHHGLEPDGIIGAGTLSALNVPVGGRIRQLIVNMETWRWVARDRGDWWIAVNIPSFRLVVMRGGKVEMSMAVIVGDEYHMTPVFSDRLRYVEFNPYWNVPLSIAQKEFLPKLRTDAAYLKRQHIRIFEGWAVGADEVDSAAVDWKKVPPDDMGRYRLRQDPGPDNALGHFAFIFPNAFDVYLHDTPSVGLFEQAKRTFSHGCIRASRAHELAACVLGGPDKGWTQEKLDSMLATGKNQAVPLSQPLPIYILYNTAVVDPETEEIYFYQDVYGRDALLEKAIFGQ